MRKSNYINQSKRQFLRTGAASIAAGAIGTSGFSYLKQQLPHYLKSVLQQKL